MNNFNKGRVTDSNSIHSTFLNRKESLELYEIEIIHDSKRKGRDYVI